MSGCQDATVRRLGQGEEAGTSRGSRENKEPKLDEMVSWPHKLHLKKYFHFAEEQRHTLFILNVYARGSQGKPDTSTVSKALGGPHGVQRLRGVGGGEGRRGQAPT